MQKPASIDLGPYQLLERIGEGGSGQVYRAKGPAGPVAIKLLGPASDMDDAARARFRREITALGQIAHPNLVTMFDHGIDGELGPYLVLPLLAGTNLRALCGGGRALCPEAALLLAQPIVHATAALHAAGYVHRDLKPENVIAGPDGAITVIDLGLAWRDGMTRHTDTGTAVGSVGYMAPEQIEGRAVDARADVFALGILVYEWIAGKRPFARARPAEEAAAMLLGTHPRLTAADRRADDDLAELVERCLAVDPSHRPSAADLAAAIDAMIDWTDSPSTERAAVVADPTGYQARIAHFRIRRVERLAREALAAGKPFVALAQCDRGLAYAPDHAQLLALVAEAEAATAQQRPPAAAHLPPRPKSPSEQVTAPLRRRESQAPPVSDAPAAHADTELHRAIDSDSSRSPAETGSDPISRPGVIRSSTTPVGVAAPSEPTRKPRSKWPYLVGAGLALWFGAITVYLVVPERTPKPSREMQVTTNSGMNEGDRQLMGDFIHVFDKALSTAPSNTGSPPPPRGSTPTTASGWLELAATQPPTEAIASIRQALALSPTWLDAQVALCAALAAAKDPGALGACDTAIRRKPDDAGLLVARGSARLQAGDPKAALVDLDKAVALDPEPKWRRLRARARSAAGDTAGAQKDLDNACQLGDAAACNEKP
ncbi:MAG: protein kinase, partial [Kofleriaceae bacterium]|nr:protein kinase [Kofleriaceae bacterium]